MRRFLDITSRTYAIPDDIGVSTLANIESMIIIIIPFSPRRLVVEKGQSLT